MPVDRIAGERVTASILEAEIEKMREKGYANIIYYNCNPDNPSGLLVSQEESSEITNFLRRKKYDNVIVVNDFAYEGTQFNRAERDAPISGEGINDVTFVGMSKIGAPGLRIAAMAANAYDSKYKIIIPKDLKDGNNPAV